MLHICIREIFGVVHHTTTFLPDCKQINIHLLTKDTYTLGYSVGNLGLVEKFINNTMQISATYCLSSFLDLIKAVKQKKWLSWGIGILVVFCNVRIADGQQTFRLYTDTAPNFNQSYIGPEKKMVTVQRHGKDTTYVKQIKYEPSLTMYVPNKKAKKGDGTAVIVIPGGGYSDVLTQMEGVSTANRLVQEGITVFVLLYRVPNEAVLTNKAIVPMQDAQRAIQLVRERAKEFGLHPNKIGVLGYSAGGHLAACVSTHFNECYIDNKQQTSLRPDFSALVYPVISFKDSITHKYSRLQLLGSNATSEAILQFSNEMHVTSSTPPAFLVHSIDDAQVKIANSLLYASACLQQKVPVELFVYEHGKHGFATYNPLANLQWTESFVDWLRKYKWIK